MRSIQTMARQVLADSGAPFYFRSTALKVATIGGWCSLTNMTASMAALKPNGSILPFLSSFSSPLF
jgi:hypothetical protein